MSVRQIQKDDLKQLSILFDKYRVFYGQDTDLDRAKVFLTERFTEADTRLFVYSGIGNILYGFAQLFPSFTSTGTSKVWILNDLFVDQNHRRKNVAYELLNHCIAYAKQTDRTKILLETGIENTSAQALYEKAGFTKSKSYNYEYLV